MSYIEKKLFMNQHSYMSCRFYTLSSIPIIAIKWNAQLTPIQVEPFVQPTGPRVHIPSMAKEIFFLFFTSSILEHIVEQSNRYAAQCKGEQFEMWQPITVEELCAYLGFMVLMGIARLPCLRDYWKKDVI